MGLKPNAYSGLFRRALTEKGLKLLDFVHFVQAEHDTLPTRPNGEGIETRNNDDVVNAVMRVLFRRALTEKGLKPDVLAGARDNPQL